MSQTSLDEIFRFVLVRPPKTVEGSQQLSLETGSPFQADLKNAAAISRAEARTVARAYAASDYFVKEVGQLPSGALIRAFLEGYAAAQPASNGPVLDLVKQLLGAQGLPATLAADRIRLADSLVATRYAAGLAVTSETLAKSLRAIAVLQTATTRQVDPQGAELVFLCQSAPLVFEAGQAPGQEPPKAQKPPARSKPDTRLLEALAELSRLDRNVVVTAEPSRTPDRPDKRGRTYDGILQKSLRWTGLAPKTTAYAAATTVTKDGPVPLTLTAEAIEKLSPATKSVLAELQIDPRQTPLPQILNIIHQAILAKGQQEQANDAHHILKAGVAVPFSDADYDDLDEKPTVPTTRGKVRPAGIADLLVVRQQIKRYESGEVGHIENVLSGEIKKREHRRLERVEESFLAETENIREETRELETTERFEMQREVSKTIEQEASLQAGLSVSGSYGPSVEFSTSLELSASASSSESTRTASDYAKDVSDRSLKRIVERVRQQRTQHLLREIEEKNLHELSNVQGGGHISGVYQWVDKIYEAQVFNYGKRLLFDIMVPEPAAFYVHSLMTSAKRPDLPAPVSPLTITPGSLTEANYMTWVARYGAVGVAPPPSPYVTMAKGFEERSGDGENARLTKIGELPVPDGYEATQAGAVWGGSGYDGSWLDVIVADRLFGGGTISLPNLRGSVGVGMQSGKINAFTLNIQIYCRRSAQALAQWSLKTYDAVRQAYQERVREFEAKLATLLAQNPGVQIQGRNPGANREIEKNELKKAAISIITAQRYEAFDAMRDGGATTYPEFSFSEAQAEGSYIRFFEQAFEWPQMTYLFYPYFWARKRKWIEKMLHEDTDPLFAEFLRAGSARVVVPVRPGFEPAMLHFLETGELWNGSDSPPDVTSPLYVSLVTELKERTGSFENEIAVGKPWDVRVPTELVKLRADDRLPEWQKQADGTWQPAF